MPTKRNLVGPELGPTTTAIETLPDVELTDKIALVIGGYAGIGLETTHTLAGAGAAVIVPVRLPERRLSWPSGRAPATSEFLFGDIFRQT